MAPLTTTHKPSLHDKEAKQELLDAKTKPSELKTTKRVTFAAEQGEDSINFYATAPAEEPAATSQEESSIISSVESVHFDD